MEWVHNAQKKCSLGQQVQTYAIVESYHESPLMHFNPLRLLTSYFNFLFVNIMENHINLISDHIFLYLVGINS